MSVHFARASVELHYTDGFKVIMFIHDLLTIFWTFTPRQLVKSKSSPFILWCISTTNIQTPKCVNWVPKLLFFFSFWGGTSPLYTCKASADGGPCAPHGHSLGAPFSVAESNFQIPTDLKKHLKTSKKLTYVMLKFQMVKNVKRKKDSFKMCLFCISNL